MEGADTTREAIETFMQSDLAGEVIRPGSEIIFAQQVDTFVRTLSVEPWSVDHEDLSFEISDFLEHELNAGRLDARVLDAFPSRADEGGLAKERFDATFDAIYAMAIEHLAALTPEGAHALERGVERSEREDVLSSLKAHVQTFVQAVKDFIHGREQEEPTQEHGAER